MRLNVKAKGRFAIRLSMSARASLLRDNRKPPCIPSRFRSSLPSCDTPLTPPVQGPEKSLGMSRN